MTEPGVRIPNCKICRNPKIQEINRDMVLNTMSCEQVSRKYGVSRAVVNTHRPHITQALALAAQRRDDSASDRLLADVEMLWRESMQVLADSKSAVKTQSITEGIGKSARTVYREYRDLGAVMSAIKVAQENRRLFGDATGAIKPPAGNGTPGVFLSISMPRMDNQGAEPAIMVGSETVLNTVEIAKPKKTQVLAIETPQGGGPHRYPRKRDNSKFSQTYKLKEYKSLIRRKGSPEQRSESARKAVQARWDKVKIETPTENT